MRHVLIPVLILAGFPALAADPLPCVNGKCPVPLSAAARAPAPTVPAAPPPISILIPPPPAPPTLSYEVWVYKLTDGKFVKQQALCIKSENLKHINDYLIHVNAFFPSYVAVSSAPGSSNEGPMPQLQLPKGVGAPEYPPHPENVIWAFKLIGGKWVKQDDHCFKSKYGAEILAYYRELVKYRNDGWYATTNTPITTFLLFEKVAGYYNADGILKDPSNPPPE
jgi:hypothetical protein